MVKTTFPSIGRVWFSDVTPNITASLDSFHAIGCKIGSPSEHLFSFAARAPSLGVTHGISSAVYVKPGGLHDPARFSRASSFASISEVVVPPAIWKDHPN